MSPQALATALLLPPFLLVWTLLAALPLALAGRRRAALALGLLSALGLVALATPMAAGTLRAALARAGEASPPAAAPRAIVILAAEQARTASGHEPGPLTLERMRAGAALARTTGLPVLVTGGALSRGAPPIARLMAEGLRADFGVEARWVEEAAADTAGNARNAAAILRGAGVGEAWLVTHGWHMARARGAFRRAGLATAPAPVRAEPFPSGTLSDFVPRPDHWAASWLAIREWVGALAYAGRGAGG